MLAYSPDPGPFADEGHQGVDCGEALRVMRNGYVVTVHRMCCEQQLEVPEVRRQHQQSFPRVTLPKSLPVVETVVIDDAGSRKSCNTARRSSAMWMRPGRMSIGTVLTKAFF